MTLKKYIQRLDDKLDWRVQWNRKLAAENARKARANAPIEMPKRMHSRLLAVQHRRYGLAWWDERKKRGLRGANGKLLPRIRVSGL